MNGTINWDKSEIIGYTAMVLAFLLVFFGIRSYRENIGGGAITFARAFKVGILITLVTCAVYVVSWEIVYFNFIPDFDEKYTAHVIETMRMDGATARLSKRRKRRWPDYGISTPTRSSTSPSPSWKSFLSGWS